MTVSDLKVDILKYVSDAEDKTFLQAVLEYIQSLRKDADWWDDLTEDEIASVELGERQLNAGEGIPHEAVREKARQILYPN
jgi:hypothetical protein